MTRNDRTRLCATCCGAVFGFAVLMLAAHVSGQEAGPALTSREGVTVMRHLMNAEFALEGRGSLSQVLTNPETADLASAVSVLNDRRASYKGYVLSLNTHNDGQFELSLVPSKGCGPAFWSSEGSVIFVGQALGCEGK